MPWAPLTLGGEAPRSGLLSRGPVGSLLFLAPAHECPTLCSGTNRPCATTRSGGGPAGYLNGRSLPGLSEARGLPQGPGLSHDLWLTSPCRKVGAPDHADPGLPTAPYRVRTLSGDGCESLPPTAWGPLGTLYEDSGSQPAVFVQSRAWGRVEHSHPRSARGQLCSCHVLSLSGHMPWRQTDWDFCLNGNQVSVTGSRQVEGAFCLLDTEGVSLWGQPL